MEAPDAMGPRVEHGERIAGLVAAVKYFVMQRTDPIQKEFRGESPTLFECFYAALKGRSSTESGDPRGIPRTALNTATLGMTLHDVGS